MSLRRATGDTNNERRCLWDNELLPAGMRVDAKFCGPSCKAEYHQMLKGKVAPFEEQQRRKAEKLEGKFDPYLRDPVGRDVGLQDTISPRLHCRCHREDGNPNLGAEADPDRPKTRLVQYQPTKLESRTMPVEINRTTADLEGSRDPHDGRLYYDEGIGGAYLEPPTSASRHPLEPARPSDEELARGLADFGYRARMQARVLAAGRPKHLGSLLDPPAEGPPSFLARHLGEWEEREHEAGAFEENGWPTNDEEIWAGLHLGRARPLPSATPVVEYEDQDGERRCWKCGGYLRDVLTAPDETFDELEAMVVENGPEFTEPISTVEHLYPDGGYWRGLVTRTVPAEINIAHEARQCLACGEFLPKYFRGLTCEECRDDFSHLGVKVPKQKRSDKAAILETALADDFTKLVEEIAAAESVRHGENAFEDYEGRSDG